LLPIRGATIVLQIVLLYLVALRLLPGLSLSPRFLDLRQARELVSFGLKVQAGKIADIGTYNVNKVFVGLFAGLSGVGSFQVGSTFVMGVRDVSMLTFSGMTPMASEIETRSRRHDLVDLYRNGVRVSLVITGAGFGFIAATADAIITLWTGQHFPVAVSVLVVLALANYVHVGTGTGTALARGMGRPEYETAFGIMLFLLNLVLGWLLGRVWGIEGVLAAALVAFSSSSLVFMYWFNRLIGFSNPVYFRSIFFPPTAAMLVGLIIVTLSGRFWSLVSGPAGTSGRIDALLEVTVKGCEFVVAYFLFLILLGYIRPHHVSSIARLLKNFLLYDCANRLRVTKS
jgi:O-antigen/teichoic acid export membrane protein